MGRISWRKLAASWYSVAACAGVFASLAQASVPPRTSGKIVYGQVFPNYGVTINPDGSDAQQVGIVGSTTCNAWSPDRCRHQSVRNA